MWESVLAKIPRIFGLFATARFHNSKGNWRCASCRFVRDADGAQISIKKSRNIMRNSSAKPRWRFRHSSFPILCSAFLPSSFPSFIFIIIIIMLIIIIILIIINIVRHRPSSKSPRLAWSSSPSSSVSPLLFLPSILPCSVLPSSFLPPSITSAPPLCWCRWRRRCRCRPVAGVNKQNQFLEFLKESKVRCFSKTKKIPRISHFKSGKKSGNCRKKGHNATCGNPFSQKFPEFLDFLQLSRFYNSKRHWRCAGCSVFMKGKIYLWKGSTPYER